LAMVDTKPQSLAGAGIRFHAQLNSAQLS
jgi:hypothetical protein